MLDSRGAVCSGYTFLNREKLLPVQERTACTGDVMTQVVQQYGLHEGVLLASLFPQGTRHYASGHFRIQPYAMDYFHFQSEACWGGG